MVTREGLPAETSSFGNIALVATIVEEHLPTSTLKLPKNGICERFGNR
jgi:hypothetical protein